MQNKKRRIVVGVSGATGSIYARCLLQRLQAIESVETHLVISSSGYLNIQHELEPEDQDFAVLADHVYRCKDVGATIASGAYATDAMIVVPCSMRTLAAIAHGLSDNLLTRAADVHLKERRRLVLVVRETPLNLAHLRNMTAVTEMGGVVYPPLPAFYHRPKSLEDLVSQTVDRLMEQIGLSHNGPTWEGT